MAQQKYQQIKAHSNIEFMFGAKIVAAPFAGQLLVERPHDSLNLSYRQLILCTGARELFLPFPGWTLPGVTGAGGLQALIKAGTPVKNERIVIAGSGPLLLASADTAKKQRLKFSMLLNRRLHLPFVSLHYNFGVGLRK
ncbi:putative oxidoreductase [Acinetobacter baumannii ATCC 17978]|nr:putative oxidoreductase [Acinetobacter baumannii ATCC 17978]